MTNGAFPTFDLGNVLTTAENIQTTRDARAQANAIAQRNAQNQVLLQNFLAQQPGGGPAGQDNALRQLFAGDPALGAQAQTFVQSQQEQQRTILEQQRQDEQAEADSSFALVEAVFKSTDREAFLQAASPETIEFLEDEGIDIQALTREEEDSLLEAIAGNLAPSLSPEGLERLDASGLRPGPIGDAPTGGFQNVVFPNGSRDQFRLDDPALDAAKARGAVVIGNRDQIVTDPVSKQVSLLRASTGELIPLTGQQAQAAQEVVPPPPAPPSVIAPPPTGVEPIDITGGLDVLEEAIGPLDVGAAVLEGVPVLSTLVEGGDERRARTTLSILDKNLERALANNPRFPVAEINRILKILPKTGFFSTETAAFEDFTALQNSLAALVQQETQTANDPNLAPTVRTAAQGSVRDIGLVIGQIGQILQASSLNAQTVTTQHQFDALPSGSFYRENGQLFRKP